jgi:ergothioneine biosynthesis protein EgtB
MALQQPDTDAATPDRADAGQLARRYREVRGLTEALCAPLTVEDHVVQSMPDASPVKWHLAHTSWFFETFLLAPGVPGYCPVHPLYNYLFNSYYNAIGDRWPRPARGLLSRPTVAEVYAYRNAVDERLLGLLEGAGGRRLDVSLEATLVLGLHHEQQHQELILTDVKHLLASNPLRPAYRPAPPAAPAVPVAPLGWTTYPAGLRWLGYEGDGFAFDNEEPRHRVFVEAFALASRPTTSGEYLAFLEDGGYDRPELWLSDGWHAKCNQGWTAPLYWERHGGGWRLMTLHGLRELCPDEPVCHLSYYEADALARWAGARLPTEAEWETAAQGWDGEGNFLDSGRLHPAPAAGGTAPRLLGDVWQWTGSPYTAYPGYRPPAGALGEYNGKFMCNQLVLRGGSCFTPRAHVRPTYRNFFPPEARWQCTGVRLARTA